MGIGFAVVAFFVVIGPLILIHEAGHFIVAKLSGIQVEEFGIGFPPRLFTLFERGGTRYTINAIPLGGFVRPVGEDDPLIEGGLASASPKNSMSAWIKGPILLRDKLLTLMVPSRWLASGTLAPR